MITAEAVIDFRALNRNYDTLKSRCEGQKVVAVIKGNAYGHNAVRTAKTLSQADMFAVSRIEEAIELRDAGIPQPILLLEGCFCAEDLKIAAAKNFHTAIHCEEQLKDLEQTTLAKPVTAWIKLDTGMHRLGVQPYELPDFVSRAEATKKLAGPVGFMSHFCCADDKSAKATAKQLDIFLKSTAPYPGPKTLANSAGILYWETSHLDYCRAGIALYGISPSEGITGAKLGLEPVMTLKTKLIAVRKHDANQPVGYGETWTSERDTYIGVIAMGYGDGFPRSAPSGTPVYINGRIVPISGRVSMDMITVDLGPDCQDKVGDSVEMWGKNLPVEKVAEAAGTIPYELVIKLANRIKKTYLD
ncbi:alanine racemase [Vibrio salinus]|uniref:alanine racemase n=1 Tax=Vibrio salinus TaxID=2899784 RepID=UPI001E63BFC4|nr:alanine racemase [Vibrio salinus]MCE0496163.1 alanine racemase [Vibrio salinus]